jgi:uncharacterized protein
MNRTTRTRTWLGLVLLVCAAASMAAANDVDVPYLTGRVVDNAAVMLADTRGRVAERVREHERKTGNQVVVLTVPTIGSASIEDYATKVFETWKLGQKDKNNGVLVVVAPQDRKMRIEVGYGLEGTLTDAQCGQIIRNVMTPQFKGGNYDRGIEEGVTAVLGQLEGTGTLPDAAPSEGSSSNNLFSGPDLPWYGRILLGAFIFGIIGLFTVMGVLTPGVGWFLYFFLIPFWAMFPIIIVGPIGTLVLLATYLVGYPIAKLRLRRTAWYKKAAADLKSKGTATIGGFTVSSSSGSSGFSSGGSSSSFSGGGGSSGGGGASGSW